MKDKKTKLVEEAKKNKVTDAVVDVDTKNKAGFLIIGLALLILISCGIYWAAEDAKDSVQTNKTDAVKFQEEYESLNGKHDDKRNRDYLEVSIGKENPVVYASFEEVLKVLDNGTGVIYFGFPECPWCRNLIPSLLEAADKAGIEKIYYLNALEDRDVLELNDKNEVVTKQEGTENYQKLLVELDDVLSDYVLETDAGKKVMTGEKRLYFPSVIFVKQGKIVGFHEGTVESQTDSKVPLTDKQKEELVGILTDYMGKTVTCDGAC